MTDFPLPDGPCWHSPEYGLLYVCPGCMNELFRGGEDVQGSLWCGVLLRGGRACWHGATAHRIRTQRGLFLVTLRCLGPNEKALIKRSSLGGWKVGYLPHCRSSMGPTRLHLVNTFRPSLAQIRLRLPKVTLGFVSSPNTSSTSLKAPCCFPSVQFSSVQFILIQFNSIQLSSVRSLHISFFRSLWVGCFFFPHSPFQAQSTPLFSSALHYSWTIKASVCFGLTISWHCLAVNGISVSGWSKITVLTAMQASSAARTPRVEVWLCTVSELWLYKTANGVSCCICTSKWLQHWKCYTFSYGYFLHGVCFLWKKLAIYLHLG